jgi:hypothetical protein
MPYQARRLSVAQLVVAAKAESPEAETKFNLEEQSDVHLGEPIDISGELVVCYL